MSKQNLVNELTEPNQPGSAGINRAEEESENVRAKLAIDHKKRIQRRDTKITYWL